MASSKEYLEYVLEQLSDLDERLVRILRKCENILEITTDFGF